MSRGKEDYLKNNTLSCVVAMCISEKTTIELRNESHVTGKIIDVDGFMNVTLENVIFCDACGNRRKFDSFFVQNRLIRFVQIPKKIDLKSALSKAFAPKSQNHPKMSAARKSILRKRQQRRMEDNINALSMMSENDKSSK